MLLFLRDGSFSLRFMPPPRTLGVVTKSEEGAPPPVVFLKAGAFLMFTMFKGLDCGGFSLISSKGRACTLILPGYMNILRPPS